MRVRIDKKLYNIDSKEGVLNVLHKGNMFTEGKSFIRYVKELTERLNNVYGMDLDISTPHSQIVDILEEKNIIEILR